MSGAGCGTNRRKARTCRTAGCGSCSTSRTIGRFAAGSWASAPGSRSSRRPPCQLPCWTNSPEAQRFTDGIGADARRMSPLGVDMLHTPLRWATAVCVAVGAALVFAVPPRLQAQQQGQPPVFTSRVELVRVDVQVIAKGGDPIVGLGLDDFQAWLDGRPRKVVSA